MLNVSINIQFSIIGILVSAAVAGLGVGMLWYGPLFGKQWMKLVGFSKKDIEQSKKKGMAGTMVTAYLASVVQAIVLSIVLGVFLVTRFVDGIYVSIVMWLGFMVPILLGGVLWEKKPLQLFWINAGYQLVALAVMSIVILFFTRVL